MKQNKPPVGKHNLFTELHWLHIQIFSSYISNLDAEALLEVKGFEKMLSEYAMNVIIN